MSSAVVPTDLQHFPLFTALPPEIRTPIWHLTLTPRVVEVIHCEDNTAGFFSQAALPAALKVCRESREAVIRLYPLSFGSYLQPRKIRFNFDLDTLYINMESQKRGALQLMASFQECEITNLKHLAIDQETILNERRRIRTANVARAFKRAVLAMSRLEDMKVVWDVSRNKHSFVDGPQLMQMNLVDLYGLPGWGGGENSRGELNEFVVWSDVGDLPDVELKCEDWRVGERERVSMDRVNISAVYGWRGDPLNVPAIVDSDSDAY